MSEFGSGIVVPLVKFAEHMDGHWTKQVLEALAWQDMEPIEREPLVKAVLEGRDTRWAAVVAYTAKMDIEWVVHDAITLWCYRSFDHLAGLDKKKCPEKLAELRAVLYRMRIGLDGPYTGDDWTRINRVYRDAALEIDRDLLQVRSDWGDS